MFSVHGFSSITNTLVSPESCWKLDEELQYIYNESIVPEINRILQDYFGPDSDCREEFLSMRGCMVGRSREEARLTVLLIGDRRISKGAKEALKRGGFLSTFHGWSLEHRSTFPEIQGAPNQFEAEFEPWSSSKTIKWRQGDDSHSQAAADVYFDLRPYKHSTKRLSDKGLAIYVDHGSSLRPATANFVQVGTDADVGCLPIVPGLVTIVGNMGGIGGRAIVKSRLHFFQAAPQGRAASSKPEPACLQSHDQLFSFHLTAFSTSS